MYEPYVAAWFHSLWNGITNINTLVPGGLDYGRNSATGTPYARFSVAAEKTVYTSEQAKTGLYRIALELYVNGPSTATFKSLSNTLDTSLLAAMAAAAGSTFAGGAGEPTGTVCYGWRVAPPAGNGTLQTEEERRAGGDVHCLKWAALVRVQW